MFDIDGALKEIRFEPQPVPDALRRNALHMAHTQTKKTARNRNTAMRLSRLAFCGAAVLLAVAALFVLLPPAHQITNYYTIDINPSISLKTGSNDQVLSVSAENDDAEKLLEGMTLKGVSFEDALKAIVRAAAAQGYLHQNSHVLVAHFGDRPGLAAEKIESAVGEAGGKTVKVLVLESDTKGYENAKRKSMKPGIALLNEKAKELGIDEQDIGGIIDSVRNSRQNPQNGKTEKQTHRQNDGNGQAVSETNKPNAENGREVSEKAKENATKPDDKEKPKDNDKKDKNKSHKPDKADPRSNNGKGA